jgi:hypothetical protein
MRYRTVAFAALWIGSMAVSNATAVAAEQSGTSRPEMKREIIPGSELMTSQERERYRQRMRGAKSEDERNRYRAEHTKQMQERARMRGLRLAEPAAGDKK